MNNSGRTSITQVRKLAEDFIWALPDEMLISLINGRFKLSQLIKLADPSKNCTKEDIANNKLFLTPSLRFTPERTESGFFYADVFLYVDNMLGKKLLCPQRGHGCPFHWSIQHQF